MEKTLQKSNLHDLFLNKLFACVFLMVSNFLFQFKFDMFLPLGGRIQIHMCHCIRPTMFFISTFCACFVLSSFRILCQTHNLSVFNLLRNTVSPFLLRQTCIFIKLCSCLRFKNSGMPLAGPDWLLTVLTCCLSLRPSRRHLE